jgi:hypothetical protein
METPSPWGEGKISSDVIWGKKYEKWKRKRGKMSKKKEERGRKSKKGARIRDKAKKKGKINVK